MRRSRAAKKVELQRAELERRAPRKSNDYGCPRLADSSLVILFDDVEQEIFYGSRTRSDARFFRRRGQSEGDTWCVIATGQGHRDERFSFSRVPRIAER